MARQTTSTVCGKSLFRLQHLLELFCLVCSLTLSLNAEILPCFTGSLPTNDPKFPQQIIQVCIPPMGWNGQLVVYVHGFVAPQLPLALPVAELGSIGGDAALGALLQNGFAFATTSLSKNGYAIEQGARDINSLVAYFKTLTAPGSLKKIYLIGGSEGGLLATLLLEQLPELYDGALVISAPLGGAPFQVKYLGDFRVVFDYFFPSVLRDEFKAFEVPPLAFLNWGDLNSGYVQQITAGLMANPSRAAQLFKVTHVALDPQDPVGSAGNAALGLLFYSVWETPDLVATAGGIPYDNRLTLYLAAINNIALNRGVERVQSDPVARAYLRRFYQPTGKLQRPLVSLHARLDPIVPFQHQLIYFGLASLAGSRHFLTIIPSNRYGHGNFEIGEVLSAFGLLVQQSTGKLPNLQPVISSLAKR